MKFHNYIPLMVWGGAVFVKKMIDSDGIKFHNYIFLMVLGGTYFVFKKSCLMFWGRGRNYSKLSSFEGGVIFSFRIWFYFVSKNLNSSNSSNHLSNHSPTIFWLCHICVISRICVQWMFTFCQFVKKWTMF